MTNSRLAPTVADGESVFDIGPQYTFRAEYLDVTSQMRNRTLDRNLERGRELIAN